MTADELKAMEARSAAQIRYARGDEGGFYVAQAWAEEAYSDREVLIAEVRRLAAENERLRAAISNHSCGHCPGCSDSHLPDPEANKLREALR